MWIRIHTNKRIRLEQQINKINTKSQNSDFLQEFRIKSGQSAVHIDIPSKYRLQQDEYYEKVHLQLEQIIQTNSELETELFVLQDVELIYKMQA